MCIKIPARPEAAELLVLLLWGKMFIGCCSAINFHRPHGIFNTRRELDTKITVKLLVAGVFPWWQSGVWVEFSVSGPQCSSSLYRLSQQIRSHSLRQISQKPHHKKHLKHDMRSNTTKSGWFLMLDKIDRGIILIFSFIGKCTNWLWQVEFAIFFSTLFLLYETKKSQSHYRCYLAPSIAVTSISLWATGTKANRPCWADREQT